MKSVLTDTERGRIDAAVRALEERHGLQLVVAVVQRSDSYEELPWKACAFGVSTAAGLLMVMLAGGGGFEPLATIAILLASGATAALLTVFWPACARLFLSRYRAATEVHQYAQSMILENGIFATPDHKALLLLVSLFEHQVVIMPDKGLVPYLSQEVLEGVISAMEPHLKKGQIADALGMGLQQLEKPLSAVMPGAAGGDLLPNILEERGQ